MSAVETCSKSAPCRLCALKKAQSPPVSVPSPSGQGNKPRPNPMGLQPIEVLDKSDFVAVKRANNTMAARKSRQKQINNLERLEKELEELNAERNHWKNWSKSIEERYGFIFPTWIAFNAISLELTAQAAPRQEMLIRQAPQRTLPLQARSLQMTMEEVMGNK